MNALRNILAHLPLARNPNQVQILFATDWFNMTNGWTDSEAITYVPFRQPQGSARVLEGTVAFDLRQPNSICQRDNWSPVPYNWDSGIIKYYISNKNMNIPTKFNSKSLRSVQIPVANPLRCAFSPSADDATSKYGSQIKIKIPQHICIANSICSLFFEIPIRDSLTWHFTPCHSPREEATPRRADTENASQLLN